MSVPYRELMNVSLALYGLLSDTHHLPQSEAICASHRAEDARVGSDAVRALHAAQAAQSAALAPKLHALVGHLEAAHDAVNAIVEEFAAARRVIREKLAVVESLAVEAHKEGWAPAPQFPPFKKGVDLSALETSVDVYCKEKGVPASDKEDLLYALLSVYNSLSTLMWLGGTEETPSPETTHVMFRRFFRSLLLCKGILGKADRSIEKTCAILKVCTNQAEMFDLLTLSDLAQMQEIAETMERVLLEARPVLKEGTKSAVADVPLLAEDE